MTIEKKLEQLEAIVEKVEEQPIEQAVKSYGKAVKMAGALKEELEKVEASFELLKKDGDALISESVSYDDV